MNLLLFLAGAVLIIGLAVGTVLAWPFLLDYRVGFTGIEFLAFRVLRVSTIPFQNIAAVARLGDVGTLTPREKVISLRLGNRPWRIRDAVAIRRRHGLVRLVVITPKDPEAFVEEAKKRLATETHGS